MDKKTKMRRRILQYAQQQFATAGYSKVSTTQFASDLKMSKSTFYQYFASKEELLFAVIGDFYESFEQEVQALIADEHMDVTGKIESFLLQVRKRFTQLQASAVEDLRRAVPEAYAQLEERRKNILLGTLIGLFEQGTKEGFFRTDISPVIIANVLVQAIQYVEHPAFIGELPYTYADMFHQVFSVIMEGSLSDRGRERFRS